MEAYQIDSGLASISIAQPLCYQLKSTPAGPL
jgi:hypothetical protein